MIISELDIPGLRKIQFNIKTDERGYFYRNYCVTELSSVLQGRQVVQANTSMTMRVGAIRGLHFQDFPFAEMKLIRVLRGAIFDVCVDLRCGSETYLKSQTIELTERSLEMLVVPEGFAHGYQVLEENSIVEYLHTEAYHPECSRAINFADRNLNISWPLPCTSISVRDLEADFNISDFTGVKT